MRRPEVPSRQESLALLTRHRLRLSLGAVVAVLAAVAIALLFSRGGGEPVAAKVGVPELSNVSAERVVVTEPTYKVTWSAKFVCGYLTEMYGHYFTAINVHNPTSSTVDLKKKVVYTLPEADVEWVDDHYAIVPIEPPTPSAKHDVSLGADEAFEIDCDDIYEIGGEPPGWVMKGFVVIEVTGSEPLLDVVVVYSGHDDYGALGVGQSVDVEQVTPKLQQYPPQETPTLDPAYVYSAKFVCGSLDPFFEEYQPVAEGFYWTDINIHNFWDPGVETNATQVYKKIVLAPPARAFEDPEVPVPPEILWIESEFTLDDDRGFQLDCVEIWDVVYDYHGSEWPLEPTKGYAVIYSDRELDVTAVYAAADYESVEGGAGLGIALDVEEVPYTRNTLPLLLD